MALENIMERRRAEEQDDRVLAGALEAAPSFGFRPVRRHARRAGKRAGRAFARGNAHAPAVDLLPARLWVRERVDEHVEKLEDYFKELAYPLEEELEVVNEEIRAAQARLETNQQRAKDLEPGYRDELAKEHRKQSRNVLNAYRETQAIIKEAERTIKANGLRRERLEEQVAHLHERIAEAPARWTETCESLLREHDVAYERARNALWLRVLLVVTRRKPQNVEPREEKV